MKSLILFFLSIISTSLFSQSVNVECGKYKGTKIHSISVNATDIRGLNSMQFTISYDSKVLKYIGTNTKKSILPKLAKTNFNGNGKGKIAFVWFDVTSLTNVSKGELFKLDFEVISKKNTEIKIDGSVTEIDASIEAGSIKINVSDCTLKLK